MNSILKGIRSAQAFLLLTVLAVGFAYAAGNGLVYRVSISGTIDLGLAPFVARVVNEAERDKADLIVFDINTLGGRLDAMIEIRDAIAGAKVPTVAYINPRAISAGALIALACKKIYMAPGGTIGAATPVSGEGTKASEKVVSYARSEFRATAEQNGRNPDVAAAMVDESIKIQGLIEEGKLLTLTTGQALKWKMADGQFSSFDDLLAGLEFGAARVIQPEFGWAEHVIRFLNHPVITSILLAVALFGLLAEVQTGGWGLPGTAGIVALGLYFGSKYLVGLVGFEEFLLIGLGLVLIGVEIFIIPGFGIAGIFGGLALLVGFGLSMVGRVPTISDISNAVLIILGALGLAVLGSLILFRFVQRTPFWERINLRTRQKKQAGFVSSDVQVDRVGKAGLALTDLRPSGTGMFDGERLDVVTEGDYIDAQVTIEIVKDEGYRLIVRRSSQP
ncbi:MAG: ATP-dependent Clp protease proteolytic subunit [Deltaproteobacteria bacterium]|nr:ATP-dependent Clp protease proteolytic subunit [Deltaproteobacteria bacterium]